LKIYTRTGDDGQTGLFGGARVAKNDPRVEAYGTLDELNAQLGFARALGPPDALRSLLERLQESLFVLGAEVASVKTAVDRLGFELVDAAAIQGLEAAIDEHEAQLPPLKTFILPSGSPVGAALHVARTVCRRAERRCLDLDALRPEVLIYLNRLGDLLFVLARRASYLAETQETPWTGRVRS
jgi:cob(I)alamin adenosyltransferase